MRRGRGVVTGGSSRPASAFRSGRPQWFGPGRKSSCVEGAADNNSAGRPPWIAGGCGGSGPPSRRPGVMQGVRNVSSTAPPGVGAARGPARSSQRATTQTRPLAASFHAGGGTRTPDTRIMIPRARSAFPRYLRGFRGVERARGPCGGPGMSSALPKVKAPLQTLNASSHRGEEVRPASA
jgi:hypothetical protein